jgi:uncharacterized protein YeaO (DUF488 family)
MITVVRIGTRKARREGLRLGTVRLLPRGVKKQDYAKRDLFDLWLPEVAPSKPLVAYAQAEPWTDARWAAYARRYHAEMRRPDAQRLIAVLAALSHQANYSVCCYCKNPLRCHRSLLGELLRAEGGAVAAASTFR